MCRVVAFEQRGFGDGVCRLSTFVGYFSIAGRTPTEACVLTSPPSRPFHDEQITFFAGTSGPAERIRNQRTTGRRLSGR
jgi:hypothetical protein